ncbi:MAG TPA: 50S ribosomal protein L9 [Candidatus Paceibacterota bacterium]|nr:50S ribosomal protein L9 [Candidatus Paceibacterota bacterium]
MKVVLLDNIKGIGMVGSVKEVSDGYARNFLLPKGLAKLASPAVLKEAESLKARKLEATKLAHDEAQGVAQKIEGATVVLAGRANERGTLFSAIGADDIAQAVSAIAGARIDASQVKLDEHIKTAGAHQVVIELVEGIRATVTVDVQTA